MVARAGNVLLALGFLLVAWVHFRLASETGRWATTGPLVALEVLLAVLFLVRHRSRETTRRPVEWAVAVAGVLLPFGLRPTPIRGALFWIGTPLQVVGLVLVLMAAAMLGRRLGIVPAYRGLQTGGLYAVVRHPMYTAYVLVYLGFLLTHPSLRNAAILAAALLLVHLRAVYEERLLAHDPHWHAYTLHTPWRFIPGVL